MNLRKYTQLNKLEVLLKYSIFEINREIFIPSTWLCRTGSNTTVIHRLDPDLRSTNPRSQTSIVGKWCEMTERSFVIYLFAYVEVVSSYPCGWSLDLLNPENKGRVFLQIFHVTNGTMIFVGKGSWWLWGWTRLYLVDFRQVKGFHSGHIGELNTVNRRFISEGVVVENGIL